MVGAQSWYPTTGVGSQNPIKQPWAAGHPWQTRWNSFQTCRLQDHRFADSDVQFCAPPGDARDLPFGSHRGLGSQHLRLIGVCGGPDGLMRKYVVSAASKGWCVISKALRCYFVTHRGRGHFVKGSLNIINEPQPNQKTTTNTNTY